MGSELANNPSSNAGLFRPLRSRKGSEKLGNIARYGKDSTLRLSELKLRALTSLLLA